MRKILASAIIAMFFVMVPSMSIAKTAVSDEELSAVIAQEGVTIDSVITVTDPIPTLFSYGDSDGFTGYTSPGWFGLRNISVSLDEISLYYPMTIDVGSSGSVTKLNIGLPLIEYIALAHRATLRLDNAKTLDTAGQPSLGSLYQNMFQFYVNALGNTGQGNGSITLSSHESSQGLEIGFSDVNFSVPNVAVNLSYGDADGFTGYTAAGYFGVRGLLAENNAGDSAVPLVTLNGAMEIDVGTSAGVTGVNVVLPTATVGSINLTVPLALSRFSELNLPQELGALYIQGLNPTVAGSLTMFSH